MSSSRRGPRRAHRLLIAMGLVAVVVIGVGAAGLAYMLGQSVPAAVSLDTPSSSSAAASSQVAAASQALADAIARPSPSAPTTASSPAAGSPSPAASGRPASSTAPAAAAAGLDGTWTVDTGIGTFSDVSSSIVGYRVDEQLANVGATTAVGRTPEVSGSLTLAGASITAVKITADLSALTSDRPMRDGQLHGQALETDQFPTATFVLTAPIALAHAPVDGETIKETATGNLTLHGVTKQVSIPIEAKLSGGVVTVVGSLKIAFADFSINPPQSMMVLSVANSGTMELQLHLKRG